MRPTTDAEHILLQQQNLFLLDKMGTLDDFEALAQYIPGVFHINNKNDLKILNLGKNCRDHVKLENDQIITMGLDYFSEYIHPYTLQHTFPLFLNYYSSGDHLRVCTEYQIIKCGGVWEDWLTVTKIIKDRSYLASISINAKTVYQSRLIAKAIDDNIFIRDHYTRFMSLTKQEKKILSLIAEGYSNTEIGGQLFISPHTVRTHRNNIYYKLELKNLRELIRYVDNFM